MKFDKYQGEKKDPTAESLSYPDKWFVGSKAGCSCTFRHTMSPELGFSEPVDWYKEEQDEVDATINLYEIISTLVADGHHVDCIDSWAGTKNETQKTIEVSLAKVPSKAFRLYENYKFIITK